MTTAFQPQDHSASRPARLALRVFFAMALAACAVLATLYIGFIQQSDQVRYSATLLSADQQPALRIKAQAQYLQVEPLTLAAVGLDRSLEVARAGLPAMASAPAVAAPRARRTRAPRS